MVVGNASGPGRPDRDSTRVTGKDMTPRMTNSGRRSGGRSSARSGNRRSSVRRDDCSSTRASGAPTQKWMPAPKPRCGLSMRSTSKRVRLGEDRRIAVCRTEQGRDLLALLDGDLANLGVGDRCALEQLQRRVVADQLLDRRVEQVRSAAQPLELFGMREQRGDAVADDVHGRLVAGVEQQRAGGDEFVLGEPGAVGVDLGDERADQVLPGARRRTATRSRRYSTNSRAACSAAAFCAAETSYSYILTMALDHGRSRCQSEAGTPNSSAMT